ncbi:hypothetical protein [Deinococcus arcticus]|uniref:hypothetical protein n=1 Tax=Deinococcus arcticus TaxID=2136176 RepID=UPI0018EBA497|nr:hypothetical protein [Deinococcus arcticus]
MTEAISVSALQELIARLPTRQPITDAFEGSIPRPSSAWYSSQKSHLIGWLGEFNTPGAYNRAQLNRGARSFYTHFQCAPGLLWLAEALGETPEVLEQAVQAIRAAGPKGAAQCGAFRKIVPWSRVEGLLAQRLA